MGGGHLRLPAARPCRRDPAAGRLSRPPWRPSGAGGRAAVADRAGRCAAPGRGRRGGTEPARLPAGAAGFRRHPCTAGARRAGRAGRPLPRGDRGPRRNRFDPGAAGAGRGPAAGFGRGGLGVRRIRSGRRSAGDGTASAWRRTSPLATTPTASAIPSKPAIRSISSTVSTSPTSPCRPSAMAASLPAPAARKSRS